MLAPRPVPVLPDPLLAPRIRFIDEFGSSRFIETIALHRSRDQCAAWGVTENVKRICALCEHFLCASSNQYERPARNRFLYDPVSHFDQLLVGRRPLISQRSQPIL